MVQFILSGFADEINSDLSIQLKELRRNNISCIEIRGVNGRNVIEHSTSEIKDFKKQLDDAGISVSALGSPIGKIKITDPFEQHLDKFKHTLELAELLGTKNIRMFSFFIPEGESPDLYRDEVLERWQAFVSEAKGTGMILAHENEKGIYGDNAERCLDIIQSINVPIVKAVFDPANFIQCDVETYPKAYELLKPHIEYMHIKDALFGNGKVVPAGLGDGKIPEILRDLFNTQDRDIVLSLEPHLGSFEGLASLETSIDISNMEESGPGKFEIAVQALRNILKQLGYSA
ncbi:MAG TPA: TIM barrel protein [Thermoclostridium sp.]|nr:TIM barrel protein [Thermoclostridium sp.]